MKGQPVVPVTKTACQGKEGCMLCPRVFFPKGIIWFFVHRRNMIGSVLLFSSLSTQTLKKKDERKGGRNAKFSFYVGLPPLFRAHSSSQLSLLFKKQVGKCVLG